MDMTIAAIVRGIIEHNDSSWYFGSLMNHGNNLKDAIITGYITQNKEITLKGQELYEKKIKGQFNESRWYFWKQKKNKQKEDYK